MPAAFARRDEHFHFVGERQQRDLVAVLGGGHRQRGGDFGGELALGAIGRAEAGRRGHIHGEHGGEFAFLAEAFHERAAEAMRDVPVNVAHIVARHVFAEILEIHAAPLEAAQIRAAHRVVHEAVRADFDAADGFEQFGDGHRQKLFFKPNHMVCYIFRQCDFESLLAAKVIKRRPS